MKKIIAVFGGSFNPPTVAHIDLAKQILAKIENIEKVVFMPVSTKYNKSGLASDDVRFSMLKKICKDEPGLEVSRIELDSNRQLYTIETLNEMQKQNQNKDIFFILGTANLREIETWHTAHKSLENFRVIVLERDKDSMECIIENNSFLTKYKNSFVKLENIDKVQLSASYVREQIKNGKLVSGMVPKQIENKVIEIYK